MEFVMFPSPIGELHFSIFSLNSTKLFPQRFPSPIGELHFSIITGKNEKELFTPVSVPYRGATFLNDLQNMFDNDKFVSVPYRGATFLNE